MQEVNPGQSIEQFVRDELVFRKPLVQPLGSPFFVTGEVPIGGDTS